MMTGLAGLVRSKQTVWLTEKQAKQLEETIGLPRDAVRQPLSGRRNDRCEQTCGEWKLPGLAGGLHDACGPRAGRVEGDVLRLRHARDDLGRVWDYRPTGRVRAARQPAVRRHPDRKRPARWRTSGPAEQDPADGGTRQSGRCTAASRSTERRTYFDPAMSWTASSRQAEDRFYSSTLTLADGRLVTLYGSLSRKTGRRGHMTRSRRPVAADQVPPIPAMGQHEYYPWAYVLPAARSSSRGRKSRPSDSTGAQPESPTRVVPDRLAAAQQRRQKGTSVLLPLRPPGYEPRVLIGGDGDSPDGTGEVGDEDGRVDRPLAPPRPGKHSRI